MAGDAVTTYVLVLRTYDGDPDVWCNLMRRSGPSREGVLAGHMPAAKAEALAGVLGLPVERETVLALPVNAEPEGAKT